MPTSEKDEKDRLAAEATDRWEDFQESLSSEKRRYPIQQFRAFWSAATRYAELTKSDSLIHKSLAAAVNGLVDFLGAERKRVHATFYGMLSAWSASFLVDMTRTSWATIDNLPKMRLSRQSGVAASVDGVTDHSR